MVDVCGIRSRLHEPTRPRGSWLGAEYSFERAIQRVDRGEDPRGPLAQAVGSKGYHDEVFEDGPFPVTP